MFERYTEKARRTIFFARYEASQLGSPYIETEHILLGLLREDEALIHRLLPNADYESIREQVVSHIPIGKKVSTSVDLKLSNEGKRVLAYAAEEAERLADRHIGNEHLLLGLLREQKSYAAQILQQCGADLPVLRARISELPNPWDDPKNYPFRGSKAWRETVEIHGSAWDGEYVIAMVSDCRRFLWQKQVFTAPDMVVRRSDGRISFDRKLAEDSANFELVEGGWNEVGCIICHWQLMESENPVHGTGYTNGRDWLCTECYEKFLAPGSGAKAS